MDKPSIIPDKDIGFWSYEWLCVSWALRHSSEHRRVEAVVTIGTAVSAFVIALVNDGHVGKAILYAGISGIAAYLAILIYYLVCAPCGVHKEMRKREVSAKSQMSAVSEKVLDKSSTLELARDLSETYRATPAGKIDRLKRMISSNDPPTAEQVEDLKHKLMSYIKNDTDMVIGTCWEDALGYKDGSEEMARISNLDPTDISGSLNALSDECMRFSARKSTAIENINASAAAIATSSSSTA